MRCSLLLFFALSVVPLSAGTQNQRPVPEDAPAYVNAEGIRMIRIPAGSFLMGNDSPTDPAILKQSPTIKNGDADERPVHKVTISHDFYMSETEITTLQWQKFHADYVDVGPSSPYATGISWDEAAAYCEWLSKKEGRLYRLPTEAEWEYASRAGSKGNFFTGDVLPRSGEANPWGLKNMNTDAAEWVLDWYGPYPDAPQTDPVGPVSGYAKVIRGGGYLGPEASSSDKYPNDGRLPYFRRSANRASMAPIFRGRHNIGFRVVQAPMPATAPWPEAVPAASLLVKSHNPAMKEGPNPKQPWFRVREVFPVPPEDSSNAAIEAAGLTPPLMGYNHAPALVVCPNGDLLAIYVSSSIPGYEDLSNANLIAARRRFGSDEWDMPGPFFDFADGKDSSPMLWLDGNRIYFFSGGGPSDIPFRWRTSDDNGATWSPVHFPAIIGTRGAYFPQPINSAARAADGTLYLPSDSYGASSLLWVSHDNGRTWSDAGGRTAGRHSSIVILHDGGILAMGGKSSNIDGYMPKAISYDGGKSWTVSKTPFPAMGESRQRPTMIRLASGKLFFAGDWQDAQGQSPPAIKQRGSYVALSSDEGKTWHIKSLPHVPVNDSYALQNRPGWKKTTVSDPTLGYSVARQGPDGLIHLLTSRTYPALEFEMNEAWILSDSAAATPELKTTGKNIHEQETNADGTVATWSGRQDASGRFVLDGPERWFFSNGKKKYEAQWRNGQKTGDETLWDRAGRKIWEWNNNPDGESVWTHFWPDGRRKSESHWRNHRCVGTATSWDETGAVISRYEFDQGVMDNEFKP